MMAFARKQDLHPTSVAPERVRQSVLGLVEHTLGGRIEIEWIDSGATPNLFVDQAQLELGLVNLIINARDAMPNGGRIIVRFDGVSEEEIAAQGWKGPFVRIRVQDDGTGIPVELLDRVAEPFFTTKDVGKGTGLGLSMVAGFVQQSGGKLTIGSEPGAGTTIDLMIPGQSGPTSRTVVAPEKTRIDSFVRKSVLLVDDDDAVRAILSDQLSEIGFEVTSVECGLRALDILADTTSSIEILLTDFAMPGINGVDTINRARRLNPKIQTILMTGFADDGLIPHNDNTMPVLRKPIDISVLKEVLSGTLTAKPI